MDRQTDRQIAVRRKIAARRRNTVSASMFNMINRPLAPSRKRDPRTILRRCSPFELAISTRPDTSFLILNPFLDAIHPLSLSLSLFYSFCLSYRRLCLTVEMKSSRKIALTRETRGRRIRGNGRDRTGKKLAKRSPSIFLIEILSKY